MRIEVLDWVIITGYITVSLALALFLFRFKSHPLELKWYTAILLCHLLVAFISEFIWRMNFNPNYAGSTYYTIAIALYAKFFLTLVNSRRLRILLTVVIPLHIILGAANLLFLQKETINTYTGISYSIIVIFLSLVYFYALLKSLPSENLLALPVFWIVTAEFMVNTGQLIFKSFAHFLINIFNDNLIVLWVFHHGLGVVGNVFVIYAALLHLSKTPARYSSKG
jgi:hypothetical protein